MKYNKYIFLLLVFFLLLSISGCRKGKRTLIEKHFEGTYLLEDVNEFKAKIYEYDDNRYKHYIVDLLNQKDMCTVDSLVVGDGKYRIDDETLTVEYSIDGEEFVEEFRIHSIGPDNMDLKPIINGDIQNNELEYIKICD